MRVQADDELEVIDNPGEGGAAVVDKPGEAAAAVVEDEPAGDGEAAAGEGQADTDEVIVSIGDEPAANDEEEHRAPEWVRDLRKSNREKDRRIRELEQQAARGAPAPQPVVVGDKPTLIGCDFDAEKFEGDLEAWHTRKREAEDQQRQRKQTEDQQRAQFQTRIDAVVTAAKTLKVADYEDASNAFEDTFSLVQQGIVVGGPEDPKSSALLRYALGKNPKKAKELAAISDPVKFAFAVAKLETQLKVTPRKSAPAPDTPVRSSVAGAAAVDNQLQRLRDEAAKTGDFSKVMAYRNQNRAKQRA